MKKYNEEVFDKTSNYSNNYYGSKYNHWNWESFKKIDLINHKGKTPYFQTYLKNKGYITEISNYELLFIELVEYYRDLDKVLKRCLDGYVDHMFCRFAFKATMFKYENAFSTVLNCWDEAFSSACKRYYEISHKTYDESYEISYVAFFDTHFANHFRYTLMYTDLDFNRNDGTFNSAKELEVYRFSWNTENPYLITNMDLHQQYQTMTLLAEQWLAQSFSPKLLSKL